MRRLLNILALVMLVLSLGMTATAHATERPNVAAAAQATTADIVAEGHTPGDADQVPADGDSDYPHHHGGCHGDHVAAPVTIGSAFALHDLPLAPVSASGSMRPLSMADPALRPPQA